MKCYDAATNDPAIILRKQEQYYKSFYDSSLFLDYPQLRHLSEVEKLHIKVC